MFFILISAIITTYNEEDNIGDCIQSLAWADEIILVDSFSTDNTVEIAKAYGAKILMRKYDNPAAQKNWAIPQANHNWIVLLDADERCSANLAEEIKDTVKDPKKRAYWVYRENYFMGKKVRFSGWQGDKVVRLFKKECRYNDNWVHEEIITDGTEGVLVEKLLHNTYKSIEHYQAKMERYAEYAVKDLKKKNIRIGFFHLHIKPLARFIKHFIFQLGFLDGRVGFLISKISANYVRLKYTKLKRDLKN